MRTGLIAIWLVVVGLWAAPAPSAVAQGTLVREAGERLLSAVGTAARQAGRSASDDLAEIGGEVVVRNLGKQLVEEGGEAAVARAARLATAHGSDAIKAVDNVAHPAALLKTIDDLPTEQVGPALRRLADGPSGRELAEAVGQFGRPVIRGELAHPGIGGKLVKQLGPASAETIERLPNSAAVALARRSDEISKLPAAEQATVLDLFARGGDRMANFVGDFAKANPKAVLFTAASVPLIQANADRLFGGAQLVFDKDGKPILLESKGLLGRTSEQAISGTVSVLRPLVITLTVIGSLLGLLYARGWIRRMRLHSHTGNR
jgi:hypothetical protein